MRKASVRPSCISSARVVYCCLCEDAESVFFMGLRLYDLLCDMIIIIIIIVIIIKAICNAQDPLKKAANALSGSEKM